MIKVSELFYSLQGEGLYLGTPSIFLRTFGCNFTCSGFSMHRGQLSKERFDVDPKKYEKYEDLPLVHTGCDSYASWDPRFKNFSQKMTIGQIVDRIEDLLPGEKFGLNKHLVITGGEPLLGWQKQYPSLISEIYNRDMDLGYITFETNGTQFLHEDLKTILSEYGYRGVLETTFSISSKLPSSGELAVEAIRPSVIKSYLEVEGCNAYFKWVVSSQEDWKDILEARELYLNEGINIPIYLMPAGGTDKYYELNKKWVAELAMTHGFKYSPRLQVDLWKNAWGT